LAVGLRRVAGADGSRDLRNSQRAQLGEGLEEVLADIVRQRLEWRDVDHLRLARKRVPLTDHRVEAGEECRERLARSGRRGNQRVFAGLDSRPSGGLRLGGRAETALEPARDGGMEPGQHAGNLLRPPDSPCQESSLLVPPTTIRASGATSPSNATRASASASSASGGQVPRSSDAMISTLCGRTMTECSRPLQREAPVEAVEGALPPANPACAASTAQAWTGSARAGA